MMLNIPHSRPQFDQQFENVASQVIQSSFLAQGSETLTLESSISEHLKQRDVIAVDSGTSALMLAIRALMNNKRHARIGIPAYACASLLFAVKAAGATPVFMDCSDNLCLDSEAALHTAKTLDVLVLVHPFGMVEPLISHNFPCPVIEDIAQSVGAIWQGKPVGTWSDISIGSLYATKPWGGVYGGFISSTDTQLIQAITAMSNPDKAALRQPYVGHHLLSNLHAVMASERIKRAAQESKQRQHWVEQYDHVLQPLGITHISGRQGNHFRYIIRSHKADKVIQLFQNIGVAAMRPVQQPLHHAQAETSCPKADVAWKTCISLPLLANMTQDEWIGMQQGFQSCLTS